MANNKLFTNVITATAIIASMATTIGAGIKVAASRNQDEIEVPEVVNSTPTPSVVPETSPEETSPGIIDPQPPVEVVDPTAEPAVVPESLPIVDPSPSTSPSDFPVASMVPGGNFDDDEDEDGEDEDELEDEHDEDKEDEDDDVEDN